MPVRFCNYFQHLIQQCITLLFSLLLTSVFAQELDEGVLLQTQADSLHNQAQQLCESYSYGQAIRMLQQSLVIEHRLGESKKITSLLLSIGDIYYNTSQYDSAIAYYDSALTIASNAIDPKNVYGILSSLAAAYDGLCQYDRALSYCDSALHLCRSVHDQKAQCRAFCIVSRIYYAMSEYENARAYSDSALQIALNTKDKISEATALGVLGSIYDDTGEYERALDCHRRALNIDTTLDNAAGMAEDLSRIGRSHYYVSHYDSALFYYIKSLILSRKIKNRRCERNALHCIGLVYYNIAQYEKAMAYMDSALVLAKGINNTRGIATTMYSVGIIYYALGKFDRAIAYYDSSLLFIRKAKSKYAEGAALGSIGTLYRALGRYEKALAYYDSALVIARETEDRYSEAATLNNIAIVCDDLAQYEKALAMYDSALSIKREIRSLRSEGITLHNMGTTLNALKLYENALSHFYQALEIQRELNDPRGEAYTLDDIGVAFYLLGQYERSLAYLDTALILKRRIKDLHGQGITVSNIGRTLHAIAKYDKAIEYYDSAVTILAALEDRPALGAIFDYIGRVHEDMANVEKAVVYYKKAIDVKEAIRCELHRTELKESFIETESDVYERLIILLIMLNRYDEAFDYLERSHSEKLRAAFERGDMVAHDPSLRRILERISFISSEMEYLKVRYQDNEIEQVVFENEMTELKGVFNQKMLDLKIHHPQLYNIMVPQQRMLQHVQESIPDSTLFMEFASVGNAYVVLLFTRHTFLAQSRESPKDSIDQWVIEALTSLKRQDDESTIDRQYKHLYDVLIRPSEPQIREYPSIVVIPYGPLHYLPFHALIRTHDNGSPQYFVQWKRISYLPSASFLIDLLEEKESKKQRLLALGNADGTLPSAEIEVDLIAQLFPESKVCKCDSARKDRFIEMCGNFQLIHLATHGILDPDPRFSYILLAPPSEGKLTVREILGLSGHFKRTSLVTLSACETAVESRPEEAGMELVTLCNAFKVAGVPTTVASLWEIADRSTALFMRDFYKNIRIEGKDKLEALRQAQISMLGHERYSHPYYWAPFILIGNWQ